jgi:hypothetical protein
MSLEDIPMLSSPRSKRRQEGSDGVSQDEDAIESL